MRGRFGSIGGSPWESEQRGVMVGGVGGGGGGVNGSQESMQHNGQGDK